MLSLQSAPVKRIDTNELEMRSNCKKLLTGLVICALFSVQKCYAQVINNTIQNGETNSNTVLATTCTIADDVEGYCVPVRKCLIILDILTHSEARARVCSSRSTPRTHPHVCCEKYNIQIETTTPAQETLRPQHILDTITSSPPRRRLTSRRPPQRESSPPQDKLTSTIPPQYASTSSKSPQQRPVPAVGEIDYQNVFTGCGVQEITTRILGGEPSSPKEFPWLARLLRRDKSGEPIFSCSGALITPKVILTTAHCLKSDYLDKIGEIVAVSLGEHETNCSSEATECLLNKKVIPISKYIAHSSYNSASKNHDNDIGLIFLKKPVTVSSYISPICLMESAVNAAQITEYYIAGWGRTESSSTSGVKLKTELIPFAWEQCAKKYRTINIELTTRQICAGGVEGMDACQGDSGGPLMIYYEKKWYVAGVVSFGLGCGKQGWPGIYVYVPSYANWIRQTIEDNAS